jgi:hypothetical protein
MGIHRPKRTGAASLLTYEFFKDDGEYYLSLQFEDKNKTEVINVNGTDGTRIPMRSLQVLIKERMKLFHFDDLIKQCRVPYEPTPEEFYPVEKVYEELNAVYNLDNVA